MNKSLLLLLSLAIPFKLMATELETQQSVDGESYVYCEVGVDCIERTVKELDISETETKEIPNKEAVLTIHFGLRSSALSAAAIKSITQALQTVPFKQLIVSGYTDKVGTASYNQRLARKRANNVVKALKKLKVAASLITIQSQCCIDNPPSLNPDARKVIIQFVQ